MISTSSQSSAVVESANKAQASKYRLKVSQAASVRTKPPWVMTTYEAAAYLCISPSTLRNLIWAGEIKHARVGGKIVLRLQTLNDFIREA